MEIKKTNILIDSRERNLDIFPESNKYVINLEDTIKNVISFNLEYAVYPKHGIEFYVNMHIEEINYNRLSSNRWLRDSFIQLPLIDYLNEFKSDESNKVEFPKPISKLSKLSISFIDFAGNPYSMGEHFLRFNLEYYVYDGNPEYHIQEIQDILYFQNLPRNYTLKILNDIYISTKKNVSNKNELKKLKIQYFQLKHEIQ
jgi:hypothetical protein